MPSACAPTPSNWALLGLLGLIWGASFMMIEIALTGFGPLTVAALRICVAATLLVGLAGATGVRLPSVPGPQARRVWAHALGMAVFSIALPFAGLAWAQEHVTSGFAGVSMATMPLMVLPLAHVFVPGETMTAHRTAGFAIGFVGAALLVSPGGAAGGPADVVMVFARLACVGVAISYALGAIVTRLAPPTPHVAISAAALLLAAVLAAPLALAVEGLPGPAPAAAWAAALYLGVVPTALATLMLVRLARTAGPSFLSLVNYQVPVWALMISVVALGEPLPPQFAAALALILAELAVSQARRRA